MDKRIERLITDEPITQAVPRLCTLAVLFAREDLDVVESDETMSNHLTVHLAKVLQRAFSPTMGEILLVDWENCLRWMSDYAHPRELLRRGIEIGDQCLFAYSQELPAGHHTRPWPDQMIVSVGHQAYTQAAANADGWSRFEDHKFSQLADYFDEYSQVLGAAGVILGFHPTIDSVLVNHRPIVTLEDFLQALADYQHQPSQATWKRLTDCADARRWIDPNFRFELPPSPSS